MAPKAGTKIYVCLLHNFSSLCFNGYFHYSSLLLIRCLLYAAVKVDQSFQRVKIGGYSQRGANINFIFFTQTGRSSTKITDLILLSLPRKPLQLHGSAPDPRRDGASGRGTFPSSGAQQPTPLCEELLLPQERHLHPVSS